MQSAMAKKSSTSPILEALREILSGEIIGTQEAIQAALEKQGFKVNQSKVSRLLHKIGAVKVKHFSGSMVYQLPKEPAPPAVNNLSQLVTDFAHNEMLIIVHTSPGSASLVARAIDYNHEKLSDM
jgi:transcriptional regulator of arginine metabolism